MSASSPISGNFIAALRRTRKISPAVAAIVAAVITAAVAIPLAMRAMGFDATKVDPIFVEADSSHLVVSTADNLDTKNSLVTGPLDGSTVSGYAYITYHDEEADAAAFALYAAGTDRPLMSIQDKSGPVFAMASETDVQNGTAFLDTAMLADGPYELFVTVADGQIQRRMAVTFEVSNQP